MFAGYRYNNFNNNISHVRNYYLLSNSIHAKNSVLKIRPNEKTHPINEFQTISLNIEKNIENVKKYIFDSFDFDICKNLFYYDKNGPQIILNNFHDIINKTTIFKIGSSLQGAIKRYYKYINYGINVTKPTSTCLSDITKEILKKFNIKIRKPENEIKIDFDEKFDDIIDVYFSPNDVKTFEHEKYDKCNLKFCPILLLEKFYNIKIDHEHTNNYLLNYIEGIYISETDYKKINKK